VAAQEVDDTLARDRSAAAQVDAAKSAVAAAQGSSASHAPATCV